MLAISWRRAETVPTECQRMGARSEKDSRFLESSRRTPSRWSGFVSWMTRGRSSSIPPDVEGVCWGRVDVGKEADEGLLPLPLLLPFPLTLPFALPFALALTDPKDPMPPSGPGMFTLEGG